MHGWRVVAARERRIERDWPLLLVRLAGVAKPARRIHAPLLFDVDAGRQRRALVGLDRRVGVDAAELVLGDLRRALRREGVEGGDAVRDGAGVEPVLQA